MVTSQIFHNPWAEVATLHCYHVNVDRSIIEQAQKRHIFGILCCLPTVSTYVSLPYVARCTHPPPPFMIPAILILIGISEKFYFLDAHFL